MINNIFRTLLLLFTTAILLAGCAESDERRHPLYQKAMRARSAGNGAEAAGCLEELLKRRPRSIYTHLRLANIYDEMLNEPLQALVHYRCYLENYPDAPDAEEVSAWILQAEKKLYGLYKTRFDQTAGTTSVPPVPPEVDNVDKPLSASAVETEKTSEKNSLAPAPAGENVAAVETPAGNVSDAEKKVVADLTAEIESLKVQLKRYQARHAVMIPELERLRRSAEKQTPETETANTVAAPAAKTAVNTAVNTAAAVATPEAADSAGKRYYTVVSGDSPGRIARKVYGRSSLYTLIMQANPRLDARKLRPGMKLVIPPKPEN